MGASGGSQSSGGYEEPDTNYDPNDEWSRRASEKDYLQQQYGTFLDPPEKFR